MTALNNAVSSEQQQALAQNTWQHSATDCSEQQQVLGRRVRWQQEDSGVNGPAVVRREGGGRAGGGPEINLKGKHTRKRRHRDMGGTEEMKDSGNGGREGQMERRRDGGMEGWRGFALTRYTGGPHQGNLA